VVFDLGAGRVRLDRLRPLLDTPVPYPSLESGTIPFNVLSGAVSHASLTPNDKAQLVEAVRTRRAVLKQALVAQTDDRFRQEVDGLINEFNALDGKIRALGGVVKEGRWAVSSATSAGG
jgi:hypothetical protein